MTQQPSLNPNPEFESLIALARQKSQAGKNSIFETVQELFLDKKDGLNDQARALMGDLLRHLIHEVDIAVRKEVAERLAKRADAAPELIFALAADHIDVARPLLMESLVLDDAALITLVGQSSPAHQLAIATRLSLSPEVCQSLVDGGDQGVIMRLITNDSATLSISLMEHLVAQSKLDESLQEPLLSRPDLPPDLTRKMYWWVSAELRGQISDDDNEPGAEDGPTAGSADKPAPLREDALIELLKNGAVPQFEAGLAKATDIPLKLVQLMLHAPTGEGLAMACKSGGFSTEVYLDLYRLTRQSDDEQPADDEREMVRLTDSYDCMRAMSAGALVERWHKEPDFLKP